MHIVFFTMGLNKGGAERVITTLSEKYVKEGHKVTIVTCINENSKYELQEKVYHYKLDSSKPHKNRILRFFARRNSLCDLLKSLKPSIVVSFLPEPNILAVSLKNKFNFPILVSERNSPSDLYKNPIISSIMKKVYKRANGVVFQTKEAQNYFNNLDTVSQSIIIPNPINSVFFNNKKERSPNKTFVSVGRLATQKNHKMLINAFKQINDKFPEYNLVIYGEGKLRTELEEQITKLNLVDKVFLLGVKHNLNNIIYNNKAFLLSSNYEGLPNALMEAMALGLPVISTDARPGGPRSLITNKFNGLLVSNNSQEEFYEAMKYIIENPLEAEKMGKQAKKYAEKFKDDRISELWLEYINKHI